jgi:poly-gamma-glutamate synthesis protein (capsule biosynthesis protein)
MLYVVGEDYGYPLSNVRGYFAEDDFTLVNFEGTFTERLSPVAKAYRFSAPARYAAVLTDGGVEAVSLANNHAGDFGQAGGADTRAALDAAGVRWGDGDTPIIAELSGGLLLGVSLSTPWRSTSPSATSRATRRASRAGMTNAPPPAATSSSRSSTGAGSTAIRRSPDDAVRARPCGPRCDLVVGSHPHVIQPMELYQGVPIFYSLGNFCFGGHSDPADQDCVLLRQQFIETAAGGVVRGETRSSPAASARRTPETTSGPPPTRRTARLPQGTGKAGLS